MVSILSSIFLFFLRFYLFLERGEGKERGREGSMRKRYMDWLPLTRPPTGDLACNLGMCPDWELNWQPFGLQAGTQSTEPHQPGHEQYFKIRVHMLLFRHHAITHLINSQYSVNITFTCTGAPKTCVTHLIAVFASLGWCATEPAVCRGMPVSWKGHQRGA